MRTQTDIWTRLLRLLEVAEELRALLEQATPESEADILTLDAFVRAGLLCDITRSRVGLELLLPWMGPRTVRAARGEAEAHHRVDRDWGGQDVDWDLAGTAFRPARLDPVNLWPD